MTTKLKIKTSLSVDDLIGNLSQLDAPTLEYLINALQQIRIEKEQKSIEEEYGFWQLIAQIDWSKDTAEEKVKPLIEVLQQASIAAINEFSEQLARSLHQLDGPTYFEALKSKKEGVSSDTFLYARCLVVAKGKAFFEEVLQHPENMPKEEDFEALLYVAKEAYEQKTGVEYEFVPSVIYESFFNQKLWKEKAILL
ncbi:MAG: DUF4240 domain-containing protein [Bacteroidota bacterium]